MTCCAHCTDAESFFGDRAARRDLKRYRKRGPSAATRHLLRMLPTDEVRGGTLLDIGGGVGAIQHELLRAGLAGAVHVDASTAYLDASREEAEREGHVGRVDYRHGDFVDLAGDLRPADIVTLDRVVCCYPDMPRLVEASASRARRLYALTYPRPHPGAGLFLGAANLYFRLRRSAFRTYLHDPEAIDQEIRRQGFERSGEAQTLLWSVRVYRRTAGEGAA